MKKLLSFCLLVAMLMTVGLLGSAMAENLVDIKLSAPLNLSDATGARSIGNGAHSGHQTRIVHTSHGDYIAYLSNEIEPDAASTINEFSLIKVENGKAELLYQDYQSYCTSSINIMADADENTYAVSFTSNKYNKTVGVKETLMGSVWRIDGKTDQVTGYQANLETPRTESFGYAQAVMDARNNKIYAFISSGDEPARITWYIFDLKTLRWEKEARSIEIPMRHCYHFIYADGKGGVVLVNQRDHLASAFGHDEIPTAPIWPASYLWDQLDMYCIPNVYGTSFYTYSINVADFSRVKDLDGDGKYTSEEERKTNAYPGTLNNHQGDAYLDTAGRLHVLYTVSYSRDAYDRSTVDLQQWHKVYDISNFANVRLLSEQRVYLEGFDPNTPEKNVFEFRMAEGRDGTLYLVAQQDDDATEENKLQIYQLSERPAGGFDYTRIYKSEPLLPSTRSMSTGYSLSGSRSLSTHDGRIAMIFSSSNRSNGAVDWFYTTFDLPRGQEYTVNVGVSPEGAGTATGGGVYPAKSRVAVSAAAQPGYRFVGWMENGVQVSDQASYTFAVTADRQLTAMYESSLAFTRQPEDQFVTEGQQASFTVAANVSNVAYQWFIQRNDGHGWRRLDGAQSHTYTTSVTEVANDGYRYRCEVSMGSGASLVTLVSDEAALYVSAKGETPKTGDGSHPVLWLALILCGFTGVCLVLNKKRG